MSSLSEPFLQQQPTGTRTADSQVLVDEYRKKKWDLAKDEKEATTALIAINEVILRGFNQVINCATSNLVQLVEQYAHLSLVGSCSAQVRSAFRFLEQVYIAMKSMERARIDRDTLEKVKKSLGHMERKLELLNKVEEDTQKEKGMSG